MAGLNIIHLVPSREVHVIGDASHSSTHSCDDVAKLRRAKLSIHLLEGGRPEDVCERAPFLVLFDRAARSAREVIEQECLQYSCRLVSIQLPRKQDLQRSNLQTMPTLSRWGCRGVSVERATYVYEIPQHQFRKLWECKSENRLLAVLSRICL